MVQLPARVFVLLVLVNGLLQRVDGHSHLKWLLKSLGNRITGYQYRLATIDWHLQYQLAKRERAYQHRLDHVNKVYEHRLAYNGMSYNHKMTQRSMNNQRRLATHVIREIKHQVSHLNNNLLRAKSASRRMVNVATRANGATCRASTESTSGQRCARAMDGNIHTDWASKHQGVGAWLFIRFAHYQLVRFVIIMQRVNYIEQFKDVDLKFSDGSSQRVTLLRRYGSHHRDIGGRGWDWFATKPTRTYYLLIRAVSVYSTYNNGFKEVQVWANIE